MVQNHCVVSISLVFYNFDRGLAYFRSSASVRLLAGAAKEKNAEEKKNKKKTVK